MKVQLSFYMTMQVASSESTLVHYAQQQARREAESTAIRRQKNELEVALRDAEIRYLVSYSLWGDRCLKFFVFS